MSSANTSQPTANATATSAALTPDIKRAIDDWINKFPADRKQSAVIPALSIVQQANGGWLTIELIDLVADYLELPKVHAYEIATFYSMFELKPVGKYKICVCTNISCSLRGSDAIVAHLRRKLAIDFGEVTADGKFSLKEVECLAACGGAPMLQIGENYYENLTIAGVDKILAQLEVE